MTYPFPTRVAGNSAALHVADHNELHARLGQALPVGLTTSSTGHLANQNQIHVILNTILGQSLPTGMTTASTGHLTHHNTIGALLNTEIWGPRGTVGPQNLTSHPLYPGTFTATISPGATTIQTAVNAGGTNRRFRILSGTYNITSTIALHAGDQLWFDNGATVTNGASLLYGFRTVGVDNLKVMGATVSGFTTSNGAGISFLDCNSVEVAYNNVSNCFRNLHNTHGTGTFVHHNNSHDATSDVYAGQGGINAIYEDNIFTGGSGGEPKLLGQTGARWAHNYSNGTRVGIWFDTSNTDCLVEWNEITATGLTNQMGSVCFEICRWQEGTGSGNNTGVEITEATKNVVRYNYIHDNYGPGIFIRSSNWVEAYGNILYQNCINNVNVAEVDLTRDGNIVDGSGNTYDTANNWIHHNMITPLSTRLAARFNIINVADTTPYLVDNTKNNNWNYNTYDNLTGSQFAWPFLTNKTFAQWQAVAQGPGGDGAFQDINGSSV